MENKITVLNTTCLINYDKAIHKLYLILSMTPVSWSYFPQFMQEVLKSLRDLPKSLELAA